MGGDPIEQECDMIDEKPSPLDPSRIPQAVGVRPEDVVLTPGQEYQPYRFRPRLVVNNRDAKSS